MDIESVEENVYTAGLISSDTWTGGLLEAESDTWTWEAGGTWTWAGWGGGGGGAQPGGRKTVGIKHGCLKLQRGE